eukprot:scaffold310993_cov32-Tisochrysis_lutea.AAC.6
MARRTNNQALYSTRGRRTKNGAPQYHKHECNMRPPQTRRPRHLTLKWERCHSQAPVQSMPD